MSDLVERIRHEVGWWENPKLCYLLDEAANEIERLSGDVYIKIREAYKSGYEYGHNSTVEGYGYYPEEAANEYMTELEEDK